MKTKFLMIGLFISSICFGQQVKEDCRTRVEDYGYFSGNYRIKIVNKSNCNSAYNVQYKTGTTFTTPNVNAGDSIVFLVHEPCGGYLSVKSLIRCTFDCDWNWLVLDSIPCGALGVVPVVRFRQSSNEVEVWIDFEDFNFTGKKFAIKINLDNGTSKEVDFTLTEKRNGLWYHKYSL